MCRFLFANFTKTLRNSNICKIFRSHVIHAFRGFLPKLGNDKVFNLIKFKNHVAPLFSDTGEEIEQCCFNNVDEAINYINNEFNSNKKNVQLEIRKKHCSDIPKKIRTNIKLPTQKYKRKYVYSY